jgi:hypothetical protein
MQFRTSYLLAGLILAAPACSRPDNSQAPEEAPKALAVATNGFQEATITTVASAADFGNARSGVIALEARSGPRRSPRRE